MEDKSIKVGTSYGSSFITGDVKGNVTSSINKLPDYSEPNKPGIKESLTQLQAAIEADSNLTQNFK